LRKEVIHLLRKFTLLAAVVLAALGMTQAAVAGKKGGDKSPNGNAWGQTGLVDGR